jgi:hypothetical protein
LGCSAFSWTKTNDCLFTTDGTKRTTDKGNAKWWKTYNLLDKKSLPGYIELGKGYGADKSSNPKDGFAKMDIDFD